MQYFYYLLDVTIVRIHCCLKGQREKEVHGIDIMVGWWLYRILSVWCIIREIDKNAVR